MPYRSISYFKELAFIFTKEYTSYEMIKKQVDHLWKANIVGCDDRIASSAFKKGLPVEHDLYSELTIASSQTLAKVEQSPKEACHRSDKPSNRNHGGNRNTSSQGGALVDEGYTKFTISIHQILAQVKDKP
ncbi:unnamed protein product [Prunus armeniaca]